MDPITNDSSTQYHAGTNAQKSKFGKKQTNFMALEDRLKTLSVGNDDDATGNSMVELLKQALHNHDAK